MSKYLVSGVAGFVGAALAKALCAAGHEVVGFDNLSTGIPSAVPSEVLFIEGDGRDAALYQNRLPKDFYDGIFHVAGQNSREVSFDNPVYDLQTNTEATLHLLHFANSVRCSRFIYASSMAVYGKQPNEAVTEETPTKPESFMAIAKLASEHYLRLYENRGIHTTVLRMGNIYGPGQNMGNLRQGMVSIFMNMLVRDGHIHVKGSPNRYRDFVYIDDAITALTACLDHVDSWGKVLNIGGSGRVTVGTLVESLCALSKEPVTVEYSGMTEGDIHGVYTDISMAAKYLGYEPEVGFKEGLSRMYTWFTGQQ